jgi:hypothetical protein
MDNMKIICTLTERTVRYAQNISLRTTIVRKKFSLQLVLSGSRTHHSPTQREVRAPRPLFKVSNGHSLKSLTFPPSSFQKYKPSHLLSIAHSLASTVVIEIQIFNSFLPGNLL